MQGSGTRPSFSNCNISRNHVSSTAGQGGGVAILSSASLTFTDTFITANAAGADGGGLYVQASGTQLSFTNCCISRNQAANLGGGLFIDSVHADKFSSWCSKWNTEIVGNNASAGGGFR